MNTNKNYFDLIDSYLNGEMTDHEAIEFENQLQKDPLLENEFQLQSDIVNSIRDFRQAELKASLNAVDVGVGGTFTALKVAAGIGAIALLGFGIYYFTGENTNVAHAPVNENPVIVEKSQDNEIVPEKENIAVIEKDNTENAEVIEEKEEISKLRIDEPIKKDIRIPRKKNNEKADTEGKPSDQPKVKLPEVVEEFDNGEGQISENLKVPENKLNKVTETYLPKTEVVELEHRKYSFHYQFYNNKLYLYGDFDNKYEILELNTPAGISIYMFYKDKFYELQQNQEKITPLNAIRNSALMRDLKTIREN